MRAPTPGSHLPRALAIAALTLGIAAASVTPVAARTRAGRALLASWPQFHNTADRSGINPTEQTLTKSNVGGMQVLWSTPTGGEIWSSPAVVNGVVYIGSDDHNVYAMNAATGAIVWTFTTGDIVRSSPSVVNGIVYVGSNDDKLYALNATTGTTIWSAATGDRIAESSPVVSGGKVYIGSHDGSLYAFNATTGALVWKSDFIWTIWESAAVANGVVYVGTDKSTLYAFDANTGATLWTATAGGLIRCTPTVVNGVVYVGADDYRLYAFNANTGALVWKTAVLPHLGIVRATPVVTNGLVYVETGETSPMNSTIYAFAQTTGATVWTNTMSDYATSSPAYASGIVYVASFDDQLYAFDADTGDQLYHSKYGTMGAGTKSSPAVVNGTVYLGDKDDSVYAFTVGLDQTPPILTLGGGYPSGYSTENDATFYLTSNEPGTFECKLDNGRKATCAAPFVYANLADGSHTFTGWAVDLAGNESLPQSQIWVQDTVDPVITVTGGPPKGSETKSKTATFTLSSNEPGVFWCSRDGRPYILCTSPFSMTGLSVGPHTFSAFAADLANNHSTTYTDSWTVIS
jgi:outer membrane protein assembly factor BamB